MIDEKEMLEGCEGGVLTKLVNVHFKKKGYTQRQVNLLIEKLKKKNQIQEIIVPPGRMLVTLHFPKKIR